MHPLDPDLIKHHISMLKLDLEIIEIESTFVSDQLITLVQNEINSLKLKLLETV